MARLCVVTGGSRGIGRAVACLLAERGHRVVVLSRSLDAAKAVTAALSGADHIAVSCDVSDERDVKRAFEQIQKDHGCVHYLVNAAAVNRDCLLARTRVEDMLSLLHTNLLGTILTCRASLRDMLRSHGGAIVNIGSVIGSKGNVGQTVYSASKAGLVGFTRSLAREVGQRNIRVNLVAPGLIHTNMTAMLDDEKLKWAVPLGRFGEPDEVADSVLFLLETPYVTGHMLLVDGGMHLSV